MADDELVISERCYARAEVFGWRSDCERMVPGEKTVRQTLAADFFVGKGQKFEKALGSAPRQGCR